MVVANAVNLTLDDLLRELRYRRWTLYRWGEAEDPALLAGVFRWCTARQVDVLLLRRNGSGNAYRAPLFRERDLFTPPTVLWEYYCESALWTLRAIMSLPAPSDPSAPMLMYPPCGECRLPGDLPTPTVIRPLGML
ncbi:hypothetical protein BU204_23100 [Actinophytocola xanthii]|uniref:Uncharacterized protein n=1 Tax=Actinophytocola xanthii TaxID=1912961 RepID=A0A1Q8CLJ3_9PSEU|nr:hypothetical protein BU204_23100 [Actinophytocola xanthii]